MTKSCFSLSAALAPFLLAAFPMLTSAASEDGTGAEKLDLESGLKKVFQFFQDQGRANLDYRKQSLRDFGRSPFLNRFVVFDVKARSEVGADIKGESIISLELPAESRFEHPDCSRIYNCTCYSPYSYTLVPYDVVQMSKSVEAIREILGSNADSTLYGCYSIVNQFEGFQEEFRCRFLKHLNGPVSQLTSRLKLPEGFVKPLDGREVTDIWLEGAIRVDSKGTPLELPSAELRPIAVEAQGQLFLALELEYLKPVVRCALAHQFRNAVVDLSACKNGASCAKRAMDAISAALRNTFEASPLVAAPDDALAPPPGEMWFQRLRKKSVVLGEPWFEQSNYLVKWWRNQNTDVAPPGLYVYSKGNVEHDGLAIILQVSQMTTASANFNGTYAELNESQRFSYAEVVKKATLRAIEIACKNLAGKLNGTVCFVEE